MLDPWGILTIITNNPGGRTRDHLPDEDHRIQTGRDNYTIYSVLISADFWSKTFAIFIVLLNSDIKSLKVKKILSYKLFRESPAQHNIAKTI